MPSFARRLAVLLLAAEGAACAGGQGPGAAPPSDRNVITVEQIREHRFSNAYDAVSALRSNWLLTRGPDSFDRSSQVMVYMDNTRVGGIDVLRGIDVGTIVYIRYFDAVAATARWGIDHGQGVIYVSTRTGSVPAD